MIILIAAMGSNRVIGYQNDIPWRGQLPADMKHFRDTTMGHTVVFGRNTWDSIPEKYRPLPGRRNIVFTHQPDFCPCGAEVCGGFEDLEAMIAEDELVFICGGENLYRQALRPAQRIVLTLVEREFEGDTFFPQFSNIDWAEVAREDRCADDENRFDYSFVWYERRPDE